MRKDVDMMRDTGGVLKHKQLTKPPRKDRKKNTLSETDPDSKDVKRDPDLKLSYDHHEVDKYKLFRVYALYKSDSFKNTENLGFCKVYEDELLCIDELKEVAFIIERDYPKYFNGIDNFICIPDKNKKDNFWIAKDKDVSYFYLNRVN